MSSLGDAIDLVGKSYLLDRLLVQVPRNYDEFISNLYREMDLAISFMESDAADFMIAEEDLISRALIRSLKQKCFIATHETDSGGHCDITVNSADQAYSWLGEAKRWNGPAYIKGGFDQLLQRYSKGTPGHNHGGLLLYIQKDRCADLVKAWRDHLDSIAVQYEALQLADDVERPGLAFRSTQVHERIGDAGPRYNVRHVGISLYRPASAPNPTV